MENKRTDLAEKMEIIGQIFEIDGMTELLVKFQYGMPQVKFNAVLIQVSSLLLKKRKDISDKIIAMHREISDEDVQAMDDGEYAQALKDTILTDVMGFFASSPHTDGKP